MAAFSIRRAIIIGYIAALIIISFFTFYTWMNLQKAEQENQQVNETLLTLRSVEAVLDDMQNIETGQRGYVISGDKSFLGPYHSSLQHLQTDTIALKEVQSQDANRENDIQELLDFVARKAKFAAETIEVMDQEGPEAARLRVQSAEGKFLMDNIRRLAQKIEEQERTILHKFNLARNNTAKQTSKLFFLLTLLFFVFLVTFFLFVRKDVSERLSRELNSRLTEKTIAFKDILDRISDGFIALDRDWNIVYVNNTVARAAGRDDLIGKNIWKEFPDTVGTEFFDAYHKAMEKQEYIFMEAFSAPHNAWYENHIYPSVHGLTIHSRDITEKKQTELKLRETTERFNTIVNATNEVLWEADLVNNTAWWNDNYYLNFGYHREKVSNTNYWQDHLHPEDRDRILQEVGEKLADKTATNISGEYRFAKADGSYVHIYDRCYIMRDSEGNAYRLIGSMTDVTSLFETRKELQKSEEQYRLLVEQATDAIFIAGADGRFMLVNSSGLRLSQYNLEELKNMTIYDLADQEELKVRPFDLTLMATESGARSERKMRKKDGSVIDVEVNAKYLSDGRFLAFIRDITERKKTEKEILHSNERFELISKTTNDALWELEFETDKGWANDRHQSLYGLTVNDPIPPHEEWECRIHPDDREKVIQSFNRVLDSMDHVWIEEYRFYAGINKDLIDVYDRTYIIRDETGKPVRMTGSMMDITARKKAEQEISKARELADKLIDSLPGVFYFYDQTGKFIRWNRQFEVVTGYTGDEIARMHPIDFFDESDKEYITGRIQEVFTKGVNDAEVSFINKEGIKIPYYFKAILINYNGESCLLGTGIDISERKRAEEELRLSEQKYKLLFDNNPLPMWMLSLPELDIIDVNEAATEHYGYTREEFLALNSVDLRPPGEILRYLEKARSEGGGVRYSEGWHHIKKDGTMIDVEVFAHDLDYDQKKVRLVLVNDVTEKKKATAALNESLENIRQLTDYIQNIREEERTHIAREIHDELGQQLTVLKMDVSWLGKKLNTADNEPARQKLKNLADMLDGTVKTVRRISSELRPSLLDDLGLVAAMDWHLREFEKRSGVKVLFNEPAHELTMPETIKTGLFRIFQESLTNVARHAEAKQVKVELSERDGHFILQIGDDGKGFDKLQADNKRTLGILGMKERTVMMGGNYEICSEPGRGTTVIISVPVLSKLN